MALDNARVYTSDGKDAGRVTEVDEEYFTSSRKGVVTDEEFRIPLGAIARVEPTEGGNSSSGGDAVVRLALDEEQLKHGYEFVKGRPNSELVKGRTESELKLPLQKQVIRYEALKAEGNDAPVAAAAPPLPAGGGAGGGPPSDAEYYYICDMCAEKFGGADDLQKHRSEAHGGPVGV
jgi:hypothetical protein